MGCGYAVSFFNFFRRALAMLAYRVRFQTVRSPCFFANFIRKALSVALGGPLPTCNKPSSTSIVSRSLMVWCNERFASLRQLDTHLFLGLSAFFLCAIIFWKIKKPQRRRERIPADAAQHNFLPADILRDLYFPSKAISASSSVPAPLRPAYCGFSPSLSGAPSSGPFPEKVCPCSPLERSQFPWFARRGFVAVHR